MAEFDETNETPAGVPKKAKKPRAPRAKKPQTEKAAAPAAPKIRVTFANEKPTEEPPLPATPRSTSRIAPEERKRRIAERAYTKALSRRFTAGSPERDWLEAEGEIDAEILAGAVPRKKA